MIKLEKIANQQRWTMNTKRNEIKRQFNDTIKNGKLR